MGIGTGREQSRPTRRAFLLGAAGGCAGGFIGGRLLRNDTPALAAPVDDTTASHAAMVDVSHGADADTLDADHGDTGVSEGLHADIGFCTDMTAHHVQAIEMCERVLGSDTGDAVQSAATEVLRNQAIEVGMMRAWLTDWGASTAPPETVMGWMTGHDGMAEGHGEGVALAEMAGYATPAELLALSRAEPGVPKGRLWLELMKEHHIGGVAMAEAAIDLATTEKVIRLATTQAEVQAWEVTQYDVLLETLYA